MDNFSSFITHLSSFRRKAARLHNRKTNIFTLTSKTAPEIEKEISVRYFAETLYKERRKKHTPERGVAYKRPRNGVFGAVNGVAVAL